MKYTGKILFKDKIQIEHINLPIKKTEIFSKILENDFVEYEIDTNENIVIITKILRRKACITLAVIRSYNYYENKIYFKLPFYNDTFSFFYKASELVNKEIGSVYLVNINYLGLDIFEYIGNIKKLNTVKKGIEKIIQIKNYQLIDTYLKKLPTQNYSFNKKHIDLTHLNTFNIDPEGTKDIDDAISIDLQNNKIYVHIVDIHSQLPVGSEEDIKFLNQCFTLYLSDKTFHCIDKGISFENLSLKKDCIRKSITFEYSYNPQTLEIEMSNIYKALIMNKNNYSYEEFDKLLENNNDQFNFIKEFTQKWKIKSYNIPYVKFILDNGYIKEINKLYSNTVSHKFIETLMILSNYTFAKHIEKLFPEYPKRNHPKTINLSDEKFCDIEYIDNFIKIKKYRSAFYTIQQSGHFGLKLENYTHFTSPIRRYIDVINHRLFDGFVYEKNLLIDILNHINEQEKLFDKIYDWYNSIIIHKYIKINDKKDYVSYIYNINKNGVFFLIEDLMIDNYVHVSKINKNNKLKWSFDPESNTLFDENNKNIKIGDKVIVTVDNISLFQVNYSLNTI